MEIHSVVNQPLLIQMITRNFVITALHDGLTQLIIKFLEVPFAQMYLQQWQKSMQITPIRMASENIFHHVSSWLKELNTDQQNMSW